LVLSKGEVFKIGWRQAYPALALDKHDALHFEVSRLDSDRLTQIVRGGIKIEATLQTPSLLRRAFPTPSGLTTALLMSAFGLRALRFASSLRDGKAAT
jgi:hypothetical protein